MKNHLNLKKIAERNPHIRLLTVKTSWGKHKESVIWLLKREFLIFQKFSTSPQVSMEDSAVPHYSELKIAEATTLFLNKKCGG